MRKIEIVSDVKARLIAQGFTGLFNPAGPCGCGLDDLAACGECKIKNVGEGSLEPEAEEWINGCSAGYKHLDLRPGHVEHGDYVVTAKAEAPDADDLDGFYN